MGVFLLGIPVILCLVFAGKSWDPSECDHRHDIAMLVLGRIM